jgi:hypothetical protein
VNPNLIRYYLVFELEQLADARILSCCVDLGRLEIDYESEAWADCDEIYDSEDMREDLPEGFKWDCCEGRADAFGCTRSIHKQGGSKIARHESQQGNSKLACPEPKKESAAGSKRARLV